MPDGFFSDAKTCFTYVPDFEGGVKTDPDDNNLSIGEKDEILEALLSGKLAGGMTDKKKLQLMRLLEERQS